MVLFYIFVSQRIHCRIYCRIYNRNNNMKKKITMEDFDNWLADCPVPYTQTCNSLNTTEYYSFNLINCEMKLEKDEEDNED